MQYKQQQEKQLLPQHHSCEAETGQVLIDEAMDFFARNEQTQFDENHRPWIIRF